MMKKILLAAAILAAPALLQAKTITAAEALNRLGGEGPAKAKAICAGKLRLARTTQAPDGQPALYLFDRATGGFLILPADDDATPLLGYSDSGSIPEVLPEPMKWWLDEYARQIQYMRSNREKAPEGSPLSIPRPEREPIAPMIQTHWDQGAPYYNQCPMGGTERTYTGCVATAMAQVMNYWKYPAKGQGSISYDAESIQKRLELNFALRSFDWDNMLNDYREGEYSDVEANAVAYLMKACGYSVKMDYGVDSSGALSMTIPRAFTKYFNYDAACREELRQYYSLSEWETLIYDQLANVGPVLYGGGSLIGGGHSFVCDGYDSDGYFHFNWGWTGMSNGYFLLDALNPYALGIGGGAGGGYNFTQDAIIGIQPPTGEDYSAPPVTLSQNGSFAGYIEDGTLFFDLFAEEQAMFVNYEPVTLKLQLGVIVEPDKPNGFETRGIPMSDTHFSLEPGYGTAPKYFKGGISLADLNLPDGTYKLTSAVLLEKDDAQWTPTRPGREYHNYIYLTRNGNEYSVDVEGVDRLQIVEGGIRGDLYYGTTQQVYVSVHNYADHEISRGFAPVVIIDGEVKLLGESVMLTVPAGETVLREWNTYLYSLDPYFSVYEPKKVDLTFFDESTYNFFAEDLLKHPLLRPNPGAPDICTASHPVVVNGGIHTPPSILNTQTTYVINDPTDIQIKADLLLNSGYFAYPVYAVVISPGSFNIEEYAGHDMFLSSEGQHEEFSTSINFPNAEEGKTYEVMIGFSYGSEMYQIPKLKCGFIYDSSWSGIEDIEAPRTNAISFDGTTVAADGLISIYAIDGSIAAAGFNSISAGSLAPGIYVAKAAGSTLKIYVNP